MRERAIPYLPAFMGFIFALFLVAPAFGESGVTFYTGVKGGGYDADTRIMAKRVAQRGIETQIENRAGSDDITLQACQDPLSVWTAQIDALWVREMKDGCYLPVLAEYGTEMAMIFFPPGSKHDELSDLDETSTIFVTGVGSGSELFARTIQFIEKEHGRGDAWSNATLETGDMRRINALASRDKVDAAIIVRLLTSDDITKLIDAGWSLGWLKDKDIDDLLYGDSPLYTGTKIKWSAPGNKTTHKGYGYEVRSYVGTTETVELDHAGLFDALLSALE
jgi:hypothetical protein